MVIQSAHKKSFIEHINSIDHRIQFTMEDCEIDGSMPFWKLCLHPNQMAVSALQCIEYPPRLTFLQWDSHHTIPAKYSVVNILHYRAWTVFNLLLLQNEEHLQKVLTESKYPASALNTVKMKINASTSQDKNHRRGNICANVTSNSQRCYMVVLYAKGLSESLEKVCSKHEVCVHFKGCNTIKSLPKAPRDKDPITKKSGIIYRYKCDSVECDDEYIGVIQNIWREVQGIS